MATHRLEDAPQCPNCNHTLDGQLNVNSENKPVPGSVTVCAHCAEALMFDDSMALVKASNETLLELGIERLWLAREMVREFGQQREISDKEWFDPEAVDSVEVFYAFVSVDREKAPLGGIMAAEVRGLGVLPMVSQTVLALEKFWPAVKEAMKATDKEVKLVRYRLEKELKTY